MAATEPVEVCNETLAEAVAVTGAEIHRQAVVCAARRILDDPDYTRPAASPDAIKFAKRKLYQDRMGLPSPTSKKGRQVMFLLALREFAAAAPACEAAGVQRTTVESWKDNDEEFLHAYRGALSDVKDTLYAEAYRRAVHGVEKPVWFQGKQVGVENVTSDGILLKMLEAEIPEKFGKKVEVGITDGRVVIDATGVQNIREFLAGIAADQADGGAAVAVPERPLLPPEIRAAAEGSGGGEDIQGGAMDTQPLSGGGERPERPSGPMGA